MSLVSLEKRWLQVDLVACQYLQAYQEDTARLFTLVHGEWTRDDGHKLKQDRFRVDIRRNFYPVRTGRQWKRLPREVIRSPSLEVFKTQLGKAQQNLV